MNFEDIYEKKKRERLMEEERGKDERKRLEELLKMMEASEEGGMDAVKGDEAAAGAARKDSTDEIILPKYLSESVEERARSVDAVDARVVEPAPAVKEESRREGGAFNTYLNALTDFNDKFYKLKETPITKDGNSSTSEVNKKYFDENSYVISSSQPSHLAKVTPQHTSPDTFMDHLLPRGRHKGEESEEEEDITRTSPIPDSGVEFCSPDWVQFSQPFHKTPEKKSSLSKKLPHHSSYHHPLSQLPSTSKPSSLHHRHYHLSTPRIIQSSTRTASEDGRHLSSLSNPHLLSTHSRQTPSAYRPSYRFSPMNEPRMTRFGSDSKILRSEVLVFYSL